MAFNFQQCTPEYLNSLDHTVTELESKVKQLDIVYKMCITLEASKENCEPLKEFTRVYQYQYDVTANYVRKLHDSCKILNKYK